MPKITGRTLQEHREGTTDRLLDAWGELVLDKGYDAVSLADVAARAGLARTAIYNYFPDRESLLFAWTDREVQRTVDTLRDEIASETTCADKLRVAVALQLRSFTDRHLPPGQEVIQFLKPETYRRFADHVAPLESALRDIVAEGVGSGEFAEADPASTVPMILACIGAERVPLTTGKHDLDEATERVTGFLLRALGAKKKRTR